MSELRRYEAVHTNQVSAPAEVLYGLVADVTRWPVIFKPSLYVRHLERGERDERFQLWASVNGQVKTWTSRRSLDPVGLRIAFQQERSQAPIASMGGEWLFRALPGGRTEVTLKHHFSAVDDDAAAVEWITSALDDNSAQELAALGRVAEVGFPVDDVVFSFEDEVVLPGAASDAYEFVYRSDLWPDRLPHVSRVSLHEAEPGVQDMEMDTVTADRNGHTTRSIRLCFGPDRIVYKQLVPPALLFGHSGAWDFADGPDGAVVTARHTVAINPDAISGVLGAGSTVADARSYLRQALGANSRATLTHAGAYAQQRAAVSSAEGTPL